jgi:hypothetical protein
VAHDQNCLLSTSVAEKDDITSENQSPLQLTLDSGSSLLYPIDWMERVNGAVVE